MNELDAVGWAIRLAKRIEGMHAVGVTHGSMSPGCVLIEGRDRTARAQLLDVRRSSALVACQSPERIDGGGLSRADDTWALACTLYAALTGNAAFTGADDDEVKRKVLTSSPVPLAVFDVGDDDLQRILDEAFARDAGERTTSVTALRAALEEWHPDPNVGALPAIEEEDADAAGLAEDDEDERTIMRAPVELPRARLNAPAPFELPPLSPGQGVPPPRASSPGAPSGVSPLFGARPGPAARAVPFPRASPPGFSSPGAMPPAHHDTPRPAEDEEEDERTIMRSVPEHFTSGLARGASRSGAFAAVAPGQSGAFPAAGPPPERDEGRFDDDEATRMLPAPTFHDEEDDDEQKTLMRSSLTPDAAPPGSSPAAGGAARPLPAAGASPRSLDAPPNGLALPPGPEGPPQGALLAAAAVSGVDAPPPGALFAPMPAPFVPGAAPLVPAEAIALTPAPRSGRAGVWIALVVLLLAAAAAAATYYVLQMR